jgi:putative hydrolase of the HAD superfamily
MSSLNRARDREPADAKSSSRLRRNRWIFFDAAGTLFTVRGSVGMQYARAAQKFGSWADPSAMESCFLNHFEQMPPLAFMGEGRMIHDLEKAWWREVVRKVAEESRIQVDVEAYFQHLFSLFATPCGWDLFAETAATLRCLVQRGYNVGLISNFDSRLLALIEEFGLSPSISQVTTSSAAGAAKPDPLIFLHACESAGTTPKSCWHVGNSSVEDVEGATNAGLRAILLDREGNHPDFKGPKIRRLSEIFHFLRM